MVQQLFAPLFVAHHMDVDLEVDVLLDALAVIVDGVDHVVSDGCLTSVAIRSVDFDHLGVGSSGVDVARVLDRSGTVALR